MATAQQPVASAQSAPVDARDGSGRSAVEDRDWARRQVLLVDVDPSFGRDAFRALEAREFAVTTAESSAGATNMLEQLRPDIVIADAAQTDGSAFEWLKQFRAIAAARSVPVILLVADRQGVLAGLSLGADDCVQKPVSVPELVLRVEAKTARPPVPVDLVTRDVRTGLHAERALLDEARRELTRGRRVSRSGALGLLQLQELPSLVQRFGSGTSSQLAQQIADLAQSEQLPLERLGLDRNGRLLVLLPETDAEVVQQRLGGLTEQIAATRFAVGDEHIRVTPVSGWASFDDALTVSDLLDRADTAVDAATQHLDLLPVRWTADMERVPGPAHRRRAQGRTHRKAQPHRERSRLTTLSGIRRKLRVPLQILATFALGVAVPFGVLAFLGRLGIDASSIAYWAVMAALLVTAGTIWIEGFFALDPKRPPDAPGAPYPCATAVIAAYLPNEAATILDTIESFQRLNYPGQLQIIVAYNTPTPMSVEDELRAIALADERVVPLRVEGSTSKAQNVNAAMSHVEGEFVGMFDADHHPDPNSFTRAWRWLSSGYDVVQGHCVIRNGQASRVARTVAVEFEAIYAVSHPGRAALHGFGLFGGSNGYWRTGLLAQTRMRGSMLTEDIDSTLRVISAGAKIASDPALISRELAPTTLSALWNQRIRWAQGWFQVSRKHLVSTLRSPNLSRRQKAGMGLLLGWREVYPWLSLQMIPVMLYKVYIGTQFGWLAPALLLATVFTLSVGPGQTLFAYRLAVPELRRHRAWFWMYLLTASLAYTEWKNIIARVAQIKELVGEHQWNVTPRALPNP